MWLNVDVGIQLRWATVIGFILLYTKVPRRWRTWARSTEVSCMDSVGLEACRHGRVP